MIIQFKSLQPGTPVVVRFAPTLSVPYGEPVGRLFSSDGKQVVDGESQLFEAYGYDPYRPGDTPIPFWGDHYIKSATLWLMIKRNVNRKVFLPAVRHRPVDAVLVTTRIQKIGKFLCREYHRHLVEAYEAVWALTDAMRRHYLGMPASRWHLTRADLVKIIGLAVSESEAVQRITLYQTHRFAELVRRLELSGLSPHYQPMKDRLQSVASEMFEVITSEYVRSRTGFNVRRSVWIPHLDAEVDMYAVQDFGHETLIVIGSNKLRVTSTKPILMSEIEGLLKRMKETRKREQPNAHGLGKSLSVSGAFFTNTADLPDEVSHYAAKHGIELFRVRLPRQWLEHPGRKHLHENDLEFLGGDRHGPLRARLTHTGIQRSHFAGPSGPP
jgi:hypothetical protein